MTVNEPPMDSPPAQRLAGKFLVLQIVLQIVFLITAAVLPSNELDFITCQFMFGLVIAQSVLAGAWLALGPGPLVRRFAGAPLWILLAASIGGIVNRPHDAFSILISIAAGTALMITLFLFGSRLFLGWRLGLGDDHRGLPLQYGLKHLMILMAVVSVLAAVFTGLKDKLPFLFITGIGGAFAVGLISSVVVPLLSTSRGWLIGGLVLGAGTAFLASLGLGVGVRHALGFLVDSDFYRQVLVIGMTAFVAVTISMLLVRAAGYRLVSGRRK